MPAKQKAVKETPKQKRERELAERKARVAAGAFKSFDTEAPKKPSSPVDVTAMHQAFSDVLESKKKLDDSLNEIESSHRSKTNHHTEAKRVVTQKQNVWSHRSEPEPASESPHRSEEKSASESPHRSELNTPAIQPHAIADLLLNHHTEAEIENHEIQSDQGYLASVSPFKSESVEDELSQVSHSESPHGSGSELASESPHGSEPDSASESPHGSELNDHIEANSIFTQKQNESPHGSKPSLIDAIIEPESPHRSKLNGDTEAKQITTQKQGASAQKLNGLVPKKPKSRTKLFELLKGDQRALMVWLCQQLADKEKLITRRLNYSQMADGIGVREGNIKGNYRQLQSKNFLKCWDSAPGRFGYVVLQIERDIYHYLNPSKHDITTQKQNESPHRSGATRGSSSNLIGNPILEPNTTTTISTDLSWLDGIVIPEFLGRHVKRHNLEIMARDMERQGRADEYRTRLPDLLIDLEIYFQTVTGIEKPVGFFYSCVRRGGVDLPPSLIYDEHAAKLIEEKNLDLKTKIIERRVEQSKPPEERKGSLDDIPF